MKNIIIFNYIDYMKNFKNCMNINVDIGAELIMCRFYYILYLINCLF